MNHSRYLVLDGIHRHEGIREEASFPFFFSNAEHQACKGDTGTIFHVFGMSRPGIKPTIARTRSGRSIDRRRTVRQTDIANLETGIGQ